MWNIDSMLLDKFQKISDRIENLIGVDCFAMSQRCWDVCVFVAVFSVYSLYRARPTQEFPATLTLFYVYILQKLIFWMYQYRKRVKNGALNPAKQELFKPREFAVFWLVVNGMSYLIEWVWGRSLFAPEIHYDIFWYRFYLLADETGTCLALCALYFCSCEKRPPKKSKVKQLLEQLANFARPKFALS